MMTAEVTRGRRRVLLVSDDDAFSAELKPCLSGMDVLSLTESSVWVADRAGLNVTRGIDAVLLDHQVSGRLQLRLYETLRPSDAVARVPVIFTRSRLTAAMVGFDHELDIYQPHDASTDETARLVSHVLNVAPVPARAAARKAMPGATAVRSGAKRTRVGIGPGFLQRLVLWGVASALIGFTFWPLVGSGPIRDAVYGPLQALSGGSPLVANADARARAPR
jgi:CheY-like chemotaxis protein